MINIPPIFDIGLRKPVLSLALVLASVSVSPGYSSGLCVEMSILVEQARSNFSSGSPDGFEGLQPPLEQASGSCKLTGSSLGQKTYFCTWEFAYRSAQADAAFDAVTRSLQDCFGAQAQIGKDQGVNHPDFYDSRQIRLEDVQMSVSIKDKSALDRTYVFLRVAGSNPD